MRTGGSLAFFFSVKIHGWSLKDKMGRLSCRGRSQTELLSTYPILIGSPQSDAESNQNKLAFFIFAGDGVSDSSGQQVKIFYVQVLLSLLLNKMIRYRFTLGVGSTHIHPL